MRDPQPLSVTLSELIAKRGLAAYRCNKEVIDGWARVTDDRIDAESRVLFIRDGIVHIGVTSSALLNELVSFHSQRLLFALQSECSTLDIKQIRFKLKPKR